jgi:Inhibitor of growth proteins N-terminal histone-binding
MMSGTGGDETYLEAFVESLSTLPHDVKRNLELLKDLDGRCSDGTSQLLRLQQQYLEGAEARMMELEIVVQQQQQQQQQSAEHDGDAMEIDPPTATTTNPVTSNYTVGLRVLGQGSRAVVIPTTLELEQYVHGVDPPTTDDVSPNDQRRRGGSTRYGEILDRQRDLLQLADEKVAVASQLYDRMDGTVRRLDRDLAEMEKLLQVPYAKGSRRTRSRLYLGRYVPATTTLLLSLFTHAFPYSCIYDAFF